MKLIPLTAYGQLRKGDVILIRRSNEYIAPVEVKEVLSASTDQEEIIISKGRNLYFITSMFLKGESWVKECCKLMNGRLYSVANNQRCISGYGDDKLPMRQKGASK
jgi:hypothetical protein